jgi:hypothetical protein
VGPECPLDALNILMESRKHTSIVYANPLAIVDCEVVSMRARGRQVSDVTSRRGLSHND